MLKTMRKKAKMILWILAIIVIPLFIWWGGGPVSREGRTHEHAGKIFGKKVSWEEFYSNVRSVENRLRLMYGNNYKQAMDRSMLEDQAWQRLMLIKAAKQEGIKVTNEDIIKEIKGTPYFQKDGKFDQQTYNMILTNFFNLTGAEYEKETHDSLLMSKLFEKITGGISMTEEELKEAFRRQNEKAVASYIILEFNDFKTRVTVDDKEIEDYYKKNSARFKKPEQVNLEYAGVSFDELEKGVQITDDDVKKYYDAHLEEFRKIVETEREQEPSENEPAYRSLDEAKEEIRRKLTQESVRKTAKEKIDKASDDLIENLDFEAVTKNNNLVIKETGFFSMEDQLPDLGWSPQFMQAAFKLKPAEPSEPVQTSKGFYLLKLKEKKPSYIPQLSEVSQKVKETLQEEKAKSLCREEAGAVYNRMKESLQNPSLHLEEVAKGFSMEVKKTPPFARRGYIPGLGGSPELTEKLFSSTAGALLPPEETQMGYAILRLDEIQPADEEKFKEEKEKFKEQALQRKKMETYQTWVTKLKEKARIESNLKPPAEESS